MTAANTNWVVLARIVRPQGRRGEVLADLLTDFPESFAWRKRLFLMPGGKDAELQPRKVELQEHWIHKGRIVFKFSGVDSINDAEKLRQYTVVIPREERMPLSEGAVYISDLLGARVIDVSEGSRQTVGSVEDVVPEGAAAAMLVVRSNASEPLLIPFVKAYLKKIDLATREIEMALPLGLTSLQGPLTEEERNRRATESAIDSDPKL